MQNPQDPYDRIIWSADVPDQIRLLIQLEKMPRPPIVKIDAAFIDENEWGVFPVLKNLGLKVFVDAKLVEIPSKLELRAKIHCRKAVNPWMLNCMAGSISSEDYYALTPGDLDGLKRFADVCHANGVRPCAVSVLSSKKPEVVANEFNGRTVREQVLYYAEELLKAGFTDLVCSPLEISAIRRDSHFDALSLNTPGIRMTYSPPDDQARTMTPVEAIRAGATRLVIGRPITNGLNTPEKNLAAIAAEIEPELT